MTATSFADSPSLSLVPPGLASESPAWIAFAAGQCVAAGAPREVAAAVKRSADGGTVPLVFDARTSHPVELDLRGSVAAVLKRLPLPAAVAAVTDVAATGAETVPAGGRGAGRPKLGVVAREVTLLPRHWQWLAAQPGGASVALRRLVEQGLRAGAVADCARESRDAAYRFMSAVAGDYPGFEEASRALFAGDLATLAECCAAWPPDVRVHALALAGVTPASAPSAIM